MTATLSAFWLGRLTLTASLVVLLIGGLGLFGWPQSTGQRAAVRYTSELSRKLKFLRVKLTGTQVLAAQAAAVASLALLALATGRLVVLVLVPLIALAPPSFIERRVTERVTRIEAQIEPWLVAIANALKASPSLGEAIASTTTVVAAPMSEEVETLVKEQELGTPLDQALDLFAERVPTRTLEGTVLALKVARRSGGDFSTLLENAAAALRELARLEGVVRTKTAEGKAQAWVIGVIPIPMVLGIHSLDPKFFAPLVASFVGHLIIASAVVLWLAAIALARKILAVDV